MSTAADIELTIDDELHRGIPKHTAAEAKAFRESVDREGRYRDPIRYWQHNGTALVLDGRHRLEDWLSRPDDLPAPPVEEVSLPDKAAARLYIVREQLARRNLTEKAFKQLLGELYNQQKKSPGRPKKVSDEKLVQTAPVSEKPENTGETAKSIAAEHNVSPDTVKRAGKLVEAKTTIGENLPILLTEIENGTVKASDAAIKAMAELDKDGLAAARKNLKAGRKWNDSGDAPKGSGTQEPPKDKVGNALPNRLVDVFDIGTSISKRLSNINKLVKECVDAGLPTFPESAVKVAIKDLRSALKAGLPHAVCPYCRGKKCSKCEHGYVTKDQWAGIPEERRK